MRLNVNVDHVATIRQARGSRQMEPDPVRAAMEVERAGAHGITFHLREDRRHMQDHDVRGLRRAVRTKMNMEMAATDEMVRIALRVKPEWVTLVPEKRRELTTEGGLDLGGRQGVKVARAVERLQSNGIEVSLFIDPSPVQILQAGKVGATMVELHTGPYADARSPRARQREYARIREGVRRAVSAGLTVNAGHGLDYQNVRRIAGIPGIEELSIGHSIVTRAIFVGIYQAVREMLQKIRSGRSA